MRIRIEWDDEALRRRIVETPSRLDAIMAAIITRQSALSETWMKQNAPWADRTGNARQGLHAVPERERLRHYTLILAHAVSYGIWLEVRNSGKYEIIQPALIRRGQAVMLDMSRLFERAFG